MNKSETGSVAWFDLTVPKAKQVSEFYSAVVGWKSQAVSMGEYDDYAMHTPDSNSGVAGVCHATGVNHDLPAQWMMYIKVDDLDASIAQVVKLGGRVLTPVKKLSDASHYAVIQDPAGAVCAVFDETGQDK
ncbi:VOC family protein [uncultured Paraglaciecola sp.]|uniref:VOC family protein n=1 Tax=uncultured Paraglaciecola sp. TaxID=1765024 RepID=UPI00261420C2|nr:VOC family protein [uncultured Paraglaciecola sp.]